MSKLTKVELLWKADKLIDLLGKLKVNAYVDYHKGGVWTSTFDDVQEYFKRMGIK